MVVSRFFNAPETASLLDVVDSEERWSLSDLVNLPMTARNAGRNMVLRSDARQADGRTDRMRECLRRCLAAGVQSYEENSMAPAHSGTGELAAQRFTHSTNVMVGLLIGVESRCDGVV